MDKLIRIGIDTSKSVFQLHGVNEKEEPVLRRKVRRQDLLGFLAKLEPTTIGLEACGASHHWAREIEAIGHKAVLVPPQHVKPYVIRGKNDCNDADATCEAMSRPKVKKYFVPHKPAGQQALQMLMGVRQGLLKRRTQVSNTIRGHAAEFGCICPKGFVHLERLLAELAQSRAVPELAHDLFVMLAGQYRHACAQLKEVDSRLLALHRGNAVSQRLAAVPSIGPIGAMALAAKAVEVQRFRSGRDFAAWLGLTPKDHSTAGRKRQGIITRAGDEMVRSILVAGAMAVIQQVKIGRGRASPWLVELVKHKKPKLAAVALANKTARIAWKLMLSGERYRPDHVPGCSAPQTPQEAVDIWTTPHAGRQQPVALPT
jgi:transposase